MAIKFDNIKGAFVNTQTDEKVSQSESLSGRLADKYGVEFDEETGMFTGKNAELANKMTNMMRTKFNFRKDQLAAKNRLDAQIKAAERQRQEAKRIQDELAAAAAAKSKAAALDFAAAAAANSSCILFASCLCLSAALICASNLFFAAN